MALAYLTINLDDFTGDDHPPISQYSTITLDPGADHIDEAADVIHVRTIVVSLDQQGKAATANGVPCVDGKVPVVAGVMYAVLAPNVLRDGPHYIPALTAGQVVDLSDYITPGAPLTPDQAAILTARIKALETTPPDHGALTGLNDDDHPQYALADGTRGAFAAPLGADDNYVTDAEKAALHGHSNKAALDLVSGTNTGDQVLPTWATISGKPTVVAEGATQADARTAIGLGSAATTASTAYATAAQGAKADTAVQPTAYDANTILAATTDNTPAALAVPAASLVGRAASGNIAALAPDAARLAIQSPWWLKAFDPIPAQLCSAAVTLQKDATVFVPFTATTDMVVTGITMVSQAATTGSPTSVRFGLYHLGSTPFVTVASPANPPVTAWLLARTASDTSIFSVADTTYTRSFDSTGGYATSVRLVQGERYAVAYQILGGTMGTIPGPPAYRYTLPKGALTGCLMSAVSQNPPPDGFHGTLGGNVLAGSYNGAFFSQIDVNPASTQARPKRTAVIGDSIPAYSSWLGWGNAQGGAKVYYAYANSIGGATIPTVISGELAAVSTIRPEVVIFHAGVNDIGVEGPTTATMQARYTAAFDALLAIPGVTTVIVCTPPPSTSITGGRITTLSEIRAWLLALGRPGVIVADTGMAMSTGDGTTSDAAKRVDGVHPNAAGMQAMGNALDDVLATL